MSYFVMSDIHGCYDNMMEALKHWNKDNEELVVIGDLIDRGPDSYKVVNELMNLQKEHPDRVSVMKGNHEEMFLAFLEQDINTIEQTYHYYLPTHRESLRSFYDSISSVEVNYLLKTEKVKSHCVKELKWLNKLPLYKETENIIFVHAGVDFEDEDWRDNLDSNYMLWARNEFIYSNIPTEGLPEPKRVFFGHTPTRLINESKSDDIWISPSGDKVCIDGLVSSGGQLNVLRVNKFGGIVEELKF